MIKTGRIAVITGAAQGIGKRVAELLAEQGYSLVLNDLRSPTETLKAVRDLGAEALEVLGDVSDEGVVGEIAAAPREKWHRADVLVNNAGISFIAPAETLSAAQYRRVLEINLVAPFLLAKTFGSMMLAQGAGSNRQCGLGRRTGGDRRPGGLQRLEAWAHRPDTDPRGRMGRKRCSRQRRLPGWVKTEMDATDQAAGGYTDADIIGRTPMGRFATPDDIARAIVFLADPQQSGYINGHALAVDGGWTADGSWESLRLRHR